MLKRALVEHSELSDGIARAMDAIRKEHPETTNEIVDALSEDLSQDIYAVQGLIVLREIGTPKALESAAAWLSAAKDYLITLFSSEVEENHIVAMYFIYNFRGHLNETVTADPKLQEVGIPILVRLLRKYVEANQSNEEIPGYSLPVIGDSRVTEDLIAMIECGPIVHTRFYIFYALGGLGDSRAVSALLAQLKHDEEHHRNWAHRSLGIFAIQDRSFDDKSKAIAIFRNALTDTTQVNETMRVCDIAEQCLKTMIHTLVSAEWLSENLTKVRVVDARWFGTRDSRVAFRDGHIPGAVPLDWQRDLGETRDGVRDLLLRADDFAEVMRRSGIGDETHVVAYAHRDYSGAARVWWALCYYGHQAVSVLNGGIDAWIAEGYPLEQGEPSEYPPAVFTPHPNPDLLATRDDVLAALNDEQTRLVDTRPPEQYAGRAVWTPAGSRFLDPEASSVEIGARAPIRAGHLPGAVHLESSLNLDPATWKYLSVDELHARFESAGLRPNQRIITYCGVGISASLGLFALKLAGYPNVALYDASWEEWGSDPDLPIEQ